MTGIVQMDTAGHVEHVPVDMHPLARFRPHPDDRPRETGFLLRGILCDKLSFIGAYAGAGKTTAIAPLTLIVAGLIKVPGIPTYGWRNVVYISEHPEQLEQILAALIRHYGIVTGLVWERIKIVEAVKMAAAEVAKVSPDYRGLTVSHTENSTAVEFPPWVIVDTQSALFEVENENDNAEMSRIVAAIKQQMALPVTVIAHTAKEHKHGQAETMTIRGGGALEGDANQVLYVSRDPNTDQRYIEIAVPKHRFVPAWNALALTYHVAELRTLDPFGREIESRIGYCTVEPVAKAERIERKKEVAEARKREAVKDTREAVLARVVEYQKLATDNPENADYYPTKSALEAESDSMGTARENIRTAVDELLQEGRIIAGTRPECVAKKGPRQYLYPADVRTTELPGKELK